MKSDLIKRDKEVKSTPIKHIIKLYLLLFQQSIRR